MHTSRQLSRVSAASAAIPVPAMPTLSALICSTSRLLHWLPSTVAAMTAGMVLTRMLSSMRSYCMQLARLHNSSAVDSVALQHDECSIHTLLCSWLRVRRLTG